MKITRNVLGAGIAAVGLAGGVAATQVLRRRHDDHGHDDGGHDDHGHDDHGHDDHPARLPAATGAAGRAGTGPDASVATLGDGEGDLPADVEVHAIGMDDGTSVRVLARGEGRPAVLLHGITLSADIWYRQLRDLPDGGFRVVALDLRGHGRSTVGSGGLSLRRLGDDVAAVLEALDLDDAVLVGHSMGGMVALELLTRDATGSPAASRVSALGLVATSASPVLGRGVPGVRALVALGGPVLATAGRLTRMLPGPSLPDTDAGDPIARVTFGADASPRHVRLIRRVTARVPARVTAELLVQLVSFDAESRLHRLALPTTVVVGTGDLMTPVRHAETLAGAIPDAELVVLPDCGHMVMLERPDELDRIIAALAKRSAG